MDQTPKSISSAEQQIIAELIKVLGPLITQIISDHLKDHGTVPTPDQVQERLLANRGTYLGENPVWKNPKT